METAGSKLYLLVCSTGPLQAFRVAELNSIASLFNIEYSFPYGEPDESVRSPYTLSSSYHKLK